MNFYATPSDPGRPGSDIEKEQVEIIREIKKKVGIPVSVKLSFFYTNPLHVIHSMGRAGADGFVLFNRFFQPFIDPDSERNTIRHVLSGTNDNGPALRFTGLLGQDLESDICTSSGIMTGRDAAGMILAGADCVQVVSTLYSKDLADMSPLVSGLDSWMDTKGYADLPAFRGKLSAERNPDPWAYRRAQYVKMLLDPSALPVR